MAAPSSVAAATDRPGAPSIAKPDSITCPKGTVLKGEAPPKGTYAWCELPDGRRHGPWMVWPSYGTTRKVATYDRDELHGRWAQWHQEGDRIESIDHFVRGVRHGPSRRWHKNGQLAQEGEFRDGYPMGRFRAWDPTGKLISDVQMSKAGGVLITWDGELKVQQTWKDGKQHGLTTAWYANGQKEREVLFERGAAHGRFVEWHDNGQKRREGIARKGVSTEETAWTRDGAVDPPMCAHGPCDQEPARKWRP